MLFNTVGRLDAHYCVHRMACGACREGHTSRSNACRVFIRHTAPCNPTQTVQGSACRSMRAMCQPRHLATDVPRRRAACCSPCRRWTRRIATHMSSSHNAVHVRQRARAVPTSVCVVLQVTDALGQWLCSSWPVHNLVNSSGFCQRFTTALRCCALRGPCRMHQSINCIQGRRTLRSS
jgi:hypothetical protein